MTTTETSRSLPPPVHTDPPPVRWDEHGRYRVGQTRVLLDLVVHAFQDGATPEEIVQYYDALSLAEAYGAIGYYLRHREDVDNYLEQSEKRAAELREKFEQRQGDPRLIRDRLHARKQAMDRADAAVSH